MVHLHAFTSVQVKKLAPLLKVEVEIESKKALVTIFYLTAEEAAKKAQRTQRNL